MKIIGHRGAKGLSPENTLASFKKAIEHHADELEFDLRVTSDGVVVLSHNAHLTDPAGNQLLIRGCTYDELKKHKPDLTTFEEVLGFTNRRVPLYIEIKPGEPTEPVIKILGTYLAAGWKPQDFRLGSYDQAALLALHQAYPAIETIVIENWSGLRATRRARQLGTKRISMLEYWLWPGFIASMRRGGYELYSFPPKKNRPLATFLLGEHSNNPAKARKWAKHGLAGVITDYPDRFEQ